jgi:hypothetical protein
MLNFIENLIKSHPKHTFIKKFFKKHTQIFLIINKKSIKSLIFFVCLHLKKKYIFFARF